MPCDTPYAEHNFSHRLMPDVSEHDVCNMPLDSVAVIGCNTAS